VPRMAGGVCGATRAEDARVSRPADPLHDRARTLSGLLDRLGLGWDHLEPFGWHCGKLDLAALDAILRRPRGRYVNVTSTTPTPLGEGKTITAIGLGMALWRAGRPATVTLRQPSLAPIFGVKGGGAGGGRAALTPADRINLNLTGDLHAIAAAHNLIAALLENHLGRALTPRIDPATISWGRVLDVGDRALRRIRTGIGQRWVLERESGFELTAASELMAIVSLATGIEDLRERLARVVVGFDASGRPVSARDLGASGATAALLTDALRPNVVATCEGTPAFVHTGPFANIAHGNSSVLADLAALGTAQYVITESGFGADAGAEKLFDIKCRDPRLRPDASVLVCSLRALKLQSGRFEAKPGRPLPAGLLAPDEEALRAGSSNLKAHVEILHKFGMQVVVAINRFPEDTPRELAELVDLAQACGAESAVVSQAFSLGGEGCEELAARVAEACDRGSDFHALYPLSAPLCDKIETIAREIYGADGVDYDPEARSALERFEQLGFGELPVCVAKTQYSLSHDPRLFGRPRGFRLPVRGARLAAGAGYVYVLAGDIVRLPGLPAVPAALRLDVDPLGRVKGLT
jgi:formate--tetrahydrofolate ligase